MRRTAGLVAGVLAVVLLLTGTGVTLAAWTSDEVTVEGESFTAGNLEVTLVPVDVPADPVASAGEPYVAKYRATVSKVGDNLRELSCDVIAESFRGVLDGYADAVRVQVILGGEQSGSVFTYSHADGTFDDPGCTLSFGESDTLEVPVEFRVESDLVCADPKMTLDGAVTFRVSQNRAGIDMPWSADVRLPEVPLDVGGDGEEWFDVTLESYSGGRAAMVGVVRALRPDWPSTAATAFVDGLPGVIVAGVNAAAAESAKAALEGAGVGAVVSVGSGAPPVWWSIRDEPSAGLSDVILWSGTGSGLITAVRILTGLNLSESKNLVDGAPGVLLSGVDAATAVDAKAKIEAAGGVVKFMPPGGAVCW